MSTSTPGAERHAGHPDPAVFAAIVEQSPDAIVGIGSDGAIRFANLTAQEMFGYGRAELLGQPIELLVPERFRDSHLIDRGEYLEAPRTRPMGAGLDLRARCKDGTEIDVDISLAPIGSTGDLRVVAAIRDASARREAEADRLELITARERQIQHERVAADLHDDLIQSVYAIGLGLLEAERDLSIPREQALARAQAQVSQAIADLRQYVHWLRTADSPDHEHQFAERLGALTSESPQTLRWTTSCNLDGQSLSDDLLRHVYLVTKELVSNVHRHSGANEAECSVEIVDGAVRGRVSDNGTGFLIDEVTRESSGLAGVRRRVERLGGNVTVTSTPRSGSAVEFRIPV